MKTRQYYIHMARRWLLLALVPMVIAGAAAYAITSRQPKLYQATATLYVQAVSNPFSQVGSGVDVQSSLLAAPSYAQLLNDTSWVLAPAVTRQLASRYPGYVFNPKRVDASVPDQIQSQLVSVNVTDTVPARAAAAADAVANAFTARVRSVQTSTYASSAQAFSKEIADASAHIKSLSARISNYHGSATGLRDLQTQLNAYRITYSDLLSSQRQYGITSATSANRISVYAPAEIPASPVGPHPLRTALIAMVIALLLVAGGQFVYDYIDDTLRSPEEIAEVAGAPILGLVKRFEGKNAPGLVTANAPRSVPAEAYRLIRTNIEYTDIDVPNRVLLVTSARAGEGKTTTASNLASVMADGGRSVILVDADLRRPSLHKVFALGSRVAGLTSLLLSNDHLNGFGMHPGHSDNLTVVPSGVTPPNAADILGSARMRDLIAHFRTKSDLVIIDAPPLLPVADSAILATIADGVVLVVDPARTKRRELEKARQTIESVGGRLIGVVVNGLNSRGDLFGHYYGYYHSPYLASYSDSYAATDAPGATPEVAVRS